MFEISYVRIIQNCIDYIDENIKEEISIEELAKKAGFSVDHFYKVFQKHVKMSIKAYITKRRLQFALFELQQGKKILDIAVNYGFESHSGFNRAFKRYFGYSPNFYRIHCPNSLPPKVDLEKLKNQKTGGIIMQPKMVKRDSFKVVGYEFLSKVEAVKKTRDIPAFWSLRGLDDGKYEGMLYEKLNPVKHGEYCFCITKSLNEEEFSYILAVEVLNFDDKKEDMKEMEMEEATYSVFLSPEVKYENFVESIQGTWKYILEDWFPNSGYEIDDRYFDFEYYDERCHYWERDKMCMEIHIPVKKR